MKVIKTVLLSSFTFLFFSCIREGMIECPPTDNLELTFTYLGDTNDPTMFVRCIDQVAVMVYDESENLVLSLNLNKNELTTRQGVGLSLAPGNYKIICWGNAHEHTQLYQCESFAGGKLHHPFLKEKGRIPTNSHLYYGSYTVQVPDEGTVQGDVPFYGAHINIEVYVRNITTSTNRTDTKLKVEARNLMPEYNMEMLPTQPYSTTYYPEITLNTERGLSQALFQVLRFNDDNPVTIEIEDLSQTLSCSIQLKKYMTDNRISVNNKNEATVPILVEFTDLGTEIKIPEWIVNEVEPGTR